MMCLIVFGEKDEKLILVTDTNLTLEEGCNKYLDNCRARNLREGTINHYKQSYTQFYKYFDKDSIGLRLLKDSVTNKFQASKKVSDF